MDKQDSWSEVVRMIGSVLQGRYEIQRQLGKRHDQQTLLASDLQTRELVVVKLLLFNHDLTWDTVKLFEREAKTLQELSHPAVPRYLNYFDIETTFGKGFALVQSYIDAPSLGEHVKAGRTFSETELKQIAKAVLEVLTYLHDRKPDIIHRDIKPDNILLSNRSGNHVGQVYLIDFGSVQAAATGGTRTVVGTYGYMPLEQFGERAVPASDLYGLGATLIYLASGQHPADLPQKNSRIDFEKYVCLSSSFIDWLRWMTEPFLEQRLESATHALQALERETTHSRQLLAPVKPHDSKVVLTKKHNLLEIYIPPKGFSFDLLPKIIFVGIWNIFLVNWYVMAFSSLSYGGFSSGIVFALLIPLIHTGAGIVLTVRILFAIFGRVRLYIDQEKISLGYELFGFKHYRSYPASQHQIVKLERTQAIYKGDSEGALIEVKPQINIWSGTKKIEVGGGGLLSELELDWLANELSEWLNLPGSQEKLKQ